MDEDRKTDEMACVTAFAKWHEENKEEIVKSGAYCNTRALLKMGFEAGWAAHKAADVWE